MPKPVTNKPSRQVFGVLFLLLAVSLFTTGCGQKSKFEKGFGYTPTPESIMFGVRSDTDTFFKNDVSFDLYYGVHDIGYDDKYNSDPKKSYQKDGYETIFFGLYICKTAYRFDVRNDTEISDYQVIDNHYFIKEISEEEAFSEEYGFRMSYWRGITYNHSEKITVPAEVFAEDTGRFVIQLIAFHKPITEGGNYYVSTVGNFGIDYHTMDENTIKLKF